MHRITLAGTAVAYGSSAMKSALRFPLFGLFALVTSTVVSASGSFPTLPPPLVDQWEVSLRALGAEELASEPVALVPEAPPVATFEEQIAELVNIERASCTGSGCPAPPLKLIALLTGVADEHSGSMALDDYFSHCDFVTGLGPFERMIAAGYVYYFAGENIAAGNSTPAATMAQWMGSAAHRANILSTGFRELGVGYFRQNGDLSNLDLDTNSDCDCSDAGESCSYNGLTHYWTQVFGMRNSVYPLVIADEQHQIATGAVDLYVYGPASAVEMRFSNDRVNWSGWQSFANDAAWSLAGGNGLRTVFSEVRSATTVYRACDRIWRTGAGGTELFVDGFDCDGAAAWSVVEP